MTPSERREQKATAIAMAEAEAVISESKRWLAVRDNWSAPVAESWAASEKLAETIRGYSTREAAEKARGA